MENNKKFNIGGESYLSDDDLSELLSFSPSYFRKQRYLRLRGEDHTFNVDAIYFGSSPRYSISEVNQWLENMTLNNQQKDNKETGDGAK